MKKILLLLAFFLFSAPAVFAAGTLGTLSPCDPNNDQCATNLKCQQSPRDNPAANIQAGNWYCATDPAVSSGTTTIPGSSSVPGIFGKIEPPPSLRTFIGGDPTGAGGIGKFVSNLIALIYSIAIIVLVLMILWGAFDWLTSEGDKEKLENARKKLINAIVGIMLFAVAFAVIRILGQFTGFKFFVGQ